MTQTKLFKLLQKTITTLMCFWLLSTQMPINVVFADEINTEENIVEDINKNEINNIDNEEDDQIIIEEDVETINKEDDEIIDSEIVDEVETETSINQELKENINNLLNTDVVNITDIDQLTNVHNEAINTIEEYDALTDEEKDALAIDYDALLEKKHNITVTLIDALIESLPSEEEIYALANTDKSKVNIKVNRTIPNLLKELTQEEQDTYHQEYDGLFNNVKEWLKNTAVGATRTWKDPNDTETRTWTAWTSSTKVPSSGTYYLTTDIYYGESIDVNGNLMLDLNGHTITFNGTSDKGSAFDLTISNGYNFHLYDSAGGGKITTTRPENYHRAVYIQKDANFNMYGGMITGFCRSDMDGGVVYICNNTAGFIMYGGTISGNKGKNGGAIYSNDAQFIRIYGGTIENNYAYNQGGAIYMNGGTLDIGDKDSKYAGGTIQSNTSVDRGGAIFASNGCKVTIYNGTIGKNTAGGAGHSIHKWGNGTASTININAGRFYVYSDYQQGYANVTGTNEKLSNKASTITFNRNGGSGGTASITTRYWSDTSSSIAVPSRTGYTFTGYYNNYGEKYYNADGTSYRAWDYIGPQTLTAYWTLSTYNISFDQQSGSNGSTSVTSTYNSAMPSITLPTRVGYVFDGYYSGTNGSGTKYYNADGSSTRIWDIDSATTLYANWVDPVTKYAAKVNSNITDAYYDGEESYFTTFEAAMLAIKTNSLSNARVTLLQNVELTDQLNSTNSLFDNLTINLNGKTIKAAANNNFVCTNDKVSEERSLTIENGTVIHNSNSYCHIFGGTGSVIRITSNNVNYDDSYNKVKDNSSLFLGNVIAEFNGGFIDPSLNVEWQYQNYLQSIVSLKGDIYYPGTKFTITTENMVSSTTIYGGKYVYNPKSYGATIPDGYVVKDINEQKDEYTYKYQVVSGGNLTLNENGGSYVSGYNEPTKYEASNGLTLPTATQITKTGYTFKGWYVDSDFSGGAVANIDINTTGDKIYYAKWEANTNTAYKVEHYKQNSDCSTYPTIAIETENKTGTTGENVTPDVKTYTGYTSPSAETKAILADGSLVFNYFYTRNKYSVKYDGNTSTSGSMSNSEHIYDVAKALTNNSYVKQYTVTYNANNGTCDKASDVANYTFAGWNTSANGNGTSYTNGQSVTNLSSTNGDVVTLYAQWNTGSVTLPSASRVGYEFDGWYDAETNGNKIGDAGSTYTPTIDKTLYARWEISTSVINFDKQDGTGGSDSVTATYGSDMSSITSPTKEGFVFVGYFDAETGGAQYYNADGSSAHVWDKTSATTLYAHWNEIIPIPSPNYGLYYNTKMQVGVQPSPYYEVENGGALNAGTYTATVTPNDGYVWPDGTADPINISYTIEKNFIGGSIIELSEYEDYAGNPVEPKVISVTSKLGYIKLSPSDYTVSYLDNTMGYGNNSEQFAYVIVTANENSNFTGTAQKQFTINKKRCKVSFVTNGGTNLEDLEVYYGTQLSPSSYTEPTKEGYDFYWWYTDEQLSNELESVFVIKDDMILYAKYDLVNYKINYDLNGGSVSTANPFSYNIETATFTLNNPTKEGYAFSGWTGTDLLEKTTTVTIENGSLGNKEYVANYDKKIDIPSAIEGLIYNNTKQIGVEEGEGYTLTSNIATEAGNHTAIASLEDGYIWSDNTIEDKNITFTISPLSISNAEITLNTYDKDYCGTPIEPSINGVIIDGLTVSDYSIEWSNNKFDENDTNIDTKEASVTVTATGNFVGTATKTYEIERKTYNIDYELSEGTNEANAPSVHKYGIDTVLPSNPTKAGYSFVEWNTQADGQGTSYAPGATYSLNENVKLYAIWESSYATVIRGREATGADYYDGTDSYFTSLHAALKTLQDGDTLDLLSDIASEEGSWTQKIEKNIVFNLNNHSILKEGTNNWLGIYSNTIINGPGKMDYDVNIYNGNVTFNGLTITSTIKTIRLEGNNDAFVLNLIKLNDGKTAEADGVQVYASEKTTVNVIDGTISRLYRYNSANGSNIYFNISGNAYFTTGQSSSFDFNNIPKENITITGGDFPTDIKEWLRDCYITVNHDNNRYRVEEYVEASIDATKYKSFLEAYNAAQDGDTIKIEKGLDFARQLQDATIANPVNKRLALNKAITIDTNGHRMSYDHNSDYYYRVIVISNDVKFTGNGFVDANFQIDEGGTLTITGGTFENIIAKHGGDLVLINGTFYNNGKVDPDRINGVYEREIIYTDAQYKQVMSECVNTNTSHIKQVSNNGEVYLVVERHNFVNGYCNTEIDGEICGASGIDSVIAEIRNSNNDLVNSYYSFDDALEKATSGQTIVLLQSVVLDKKTTIPNGVTVKFNGTSTLTNNSTLSIKGTIELPQPTNEGFNPILINYGTLVIDNGGLLYSKKIDLDIGQFNTLKIKAGGSHKVCEPIGDPINDPNNYISGYAFGPAGSGAWTTMSAGEVIQQPIEADISLGYRYSFVNAEATISYGIANLDEYILESGTYALGDIYIDNIKQARFIIEEGVNIIVNENTSLKLNKDDYLRDYTKQSIAQTSPGYGLIEKIEDDLYYCTVAKLYNINYELNGGTNPENAPMHYVQEQETVLPTPTREGYRFLGWTITNDEADKNYITNITTTDTGNKTFYAKWENSKITITVKSKGLNEEGEAVENIALLTGGGVLSPDKETIFTAKSNNTFYTFDHWEVNGINVGTNTTLSRSFNEDAILYAVFKYNVANGIKIHVEALRPFSIDILGRESWSKWEHILGSSYDVAPNNDGLYEIALTVVAGSRVKVSYDNTHSDFTAWVNRLGLIMSKDPVYILNSIFVENDLRLETNDSTDMYYEANFLAYNGSQIVKSGTFDSYDQLMSIAPLSGPGLLGYKFVGWYIGEKKLGVDITNDETLISAIETMELTNKILNVIPKYEEDKVQATVTINNATITFDDIDLIGSDLPVVEDYYVGDTISLTAPEIEGYEFSYWAIEQPNGDVKTYSYEPTISYKIGVPNIKLYVIYDSDVELEPIISVDGATINGSEGNERVSFTVSRNVPNLPDKYRLIENGILYSTQSTWDGKAGDVIENSLRFDKVDANGNITLKSATKSAISSNNDCTGHFTLNKTAVGHLSSKMYFRGYMLVLVNENGNDVFKIYYTDVYKTSYALLAAGKSPEIFKAQ